MKGLGLLLLTCLSTIDDGLVFLQRTPILHTAFDGCHQGRLLRALAGEVDTRAPYIRGPLHEARLGTSRDIFEGHHQTLAAATAAAAAIVTIAKSITAGILVRENTLKDSRSAPPCLRQILMILHVLRFREFVIKEINEC